jgi:hypothetical protein
MKQQVPKVAVACFQNLLRLRQIHRRVGPEITVQLVLALITSRSDYCNSVLAGLPQATMQLLQRLQNAAARLIFSSNYREHVTPPLIQLHWLPVRSRIQYKLCTLRYAVHDRRSPAYIFICQHDSGRCRTDNTLWSAASSGMCYMTPRLRAKFGE